MKQSIRIPVPAFLVAVVISLSIGQNAMAAQFTKIVNGREVVVHTNPLPVVMHRLVPPQHGRHVTVRELHQGNIPTPGRMVNQRRR